MTATPATAPPESNTNTAEDSRQTTSANGFGSVAHVAHVADSSDYGGRVLERVHQFLGRFVAYPSEHTHVAHTLWVAHTHFMDMWESTPRIAFLSPEPASGKTRAIEVTKLLVPRPVEAINVSSAYLFRKVADSAGRPTILYDEIDTVFGPKAKENEDIRALLNAGHRKGAVAGRCVVKGRTVETEEYAAYCAVALAGLGGLPDTILSRSVVVQMRRRSQTEQVEPFRERLHRGEGNALRDQLARWAKDYAYLPFPTMPTGIVDRDADVWEPLLTIAELAGGDWLERARVAAVAHVALSRESTPSLGVRLLADLHTVFGRDSAIPTVEVLKRLCDLDEAPWGELSGRPLDARGLARRLKEYGIKPKDLRQPFASVVKGYGRDDLWDAWQRYVHQSHDTCATCATSATRGDCSGCGAPLTLGDEAAQSGWCPTCAAALEAEAEA